MSYLEYIALVESLKLLFEKRVIAVIPDLENYAYQALVDWISENLDTRNGNLVASEETIAILNDFDNAFLRVLNGMKAYKGAVSSLIKDLPKIGNAIEQYQTSVNGISWAAAEVKPVQKLVVNEIINAYADNGLNANFVQPLRDLLYQNIAAGTSVKETKAILKDFIKSDEAPSKLSRYITQTSQQAVDSYAGAINKKLMDKFDYPYLQMSGSLIKTSAPQCVKGIREFDGLISKEIWENVIKPIAEKHGLIAGTTFRNLPFNKLHWGCRHEFTPTMVKVEKKEKKDDKKIKGNLIPPVVPYGKPDEWETILTHENGGFIRVHISVDKSEDDYKKIIDCCNHFSLQGNETYILPNIKNSDSEDYKRLFGALTGTRYERKCPDFKVGELFFEHEGFKSSANALRNMFNRGLKQSSRVVIDDDGSSINYIKKSVFRRIKEKQEINEVWQRKKDGTLINIYKNENPTM